MKKVEIIEWSKKFNDTKYPSGIYKDLVIDSKSHDDKFIILGAWKTGSISKEVQTSNNCIYQSGYEKFNLNDKWTYHSPVGRVNWEFINANMEYIRSKIPKEFPESKPEILQELEDRKGFGFIWGVFVLHCFYPEIYPLYDQHVYRAYQFLKSGQIKSGAASKSWLEYSAYTNFFKSTRELHNIKITTLDRGLWSYGKWLNQMEKLREKNHYPQIDEIEKLNRVNDFTGNWIDAYTLKEEKIFSSKLENNILTIKRNFTGQRTPNTETYTIKDINDIQLFMKRRIGFVKLDNGVTSVSQVRSEQETGLGRFIFHNIQRNQTFAQTSSHIAAIFTIAGIWTMRETKTRGMEFQLGPNIDWEKRLTQYHLIDSDIEP